MTDQPDLFDRQLLKQHRRRALDRAVPGADFLLRSVAEDLADRLRLIKRDFQTAVDLGGHRGLIGEAIAASGKAVHILRGDLFIAEQAIPGADFVFDDALPPLRESSIDLIVSGLNLHYVNDLPGALVQIRKALRPDGLFLATLVGSGTLKELRECLTAAELELKGGAAPRVLPFADTRDLGNLLHRAGFALPVTDTDDLTVRYDNMFGLMADLRAMGATSMLHERSRKPLAKSVFMRAADLYAQRFADDDGRIRATFSLVTLSGWAPHESQQKPLRPGSAKSRLADALNVAEMKVKG